MSSVAIIGAGHNGLVAALHLARSGRRVTVLERSDRIGGLCAPIEFAPGYTLPGMFADVAFDDRHFPALELERTAPHQIAVSPAGGDVRTVDRQLGNVDNAGAWRAFIDRVRPFAREVFSSPPPPILPSTTSDFWKLGRTGLGLRRLGRPDMVELMRVPPMCAADWVNEHFEDDPVLAEFVASPGVLNGFAGPWSAGTAASLLIEEAMRTPPVRGGSAAIVGALKARCEAAGVTIETGTEVRRIIVEGGRATGVELVSGDSHSADVLLAACDPRTAMLDLVDPVQLPAKVEQQFLSIRSRGTTARLMLALDGPLELDGLDTAPERAFLGNGSLDGLERAYDAVKYGEFSQRPVLDVWAPSVVDDKLAPAGHHVVSVLASYVPHELRAGWTDESRAQLQDRILDRLAESAPTVRDRIVHATLWTPPDIEREYGLTGGCLQHAEHALDQLLFMRPAASAAHYGTAIGGLFLGSGGSHPCGGVTGLPGLLAARAIERSK